MKILKIRRKGAILILSLAYIMILISFLAFSYDVSRVIYYRMYTRNLASAIGISIVNETSYSYHDDVNGPRAILVYDASVIPLEHKDNWNRKYANNKYARELKNMINDYDGSYEAKEVYLNPSGNLNVPNTPRFIKGMADGINGEVEVIIKGEVKMLFLKGLGNDTIIIQESAITQAYAKEKNRGGGSSTEKDNQKTEEWNNF